MKNVNKVRTYWGYTFFFEDTTMRDRFIDLFRDLIISYEMGMWETTPWLHIRVGKGVIKQIKDGFGKDMVTTKQSRYYVKKTA